MTKKIIALFCLITSLTFSQNEKEFVFSQEQVDSLKDLYNEGLSTNIIFHLSEISINETNPAEKLQYSQLLLTQALQTDELEYIKIAYLQKGNALQLQGEYHEALEAYFKCLDWAKKQDGKNLIRNLLISIADTYSMIGNSESAEKYYDRAILLLRKDADSLNLATALLNAGDEYYNTEQYDKALDYFKESGQIFKKLNYDIGNAYNLGNTGMVYAKQGKDELALFNMNEAINILEANEDYYAISEFVNYMSDLYQEKEDINTAINYAYRSLELSSKYNLKDQISNANLQLSELMEISGNYKEALKHFIQHDIYQDSIINLDNIQNMANLEVGKTEAELEVETQKRKTQRIILWATVGVLFLIGLLARGLYKRNKFIKATNKIIAAEKERSDDLLLNILPEDTAQELKDKGKVEAKKYPSVTVLFTDFKGFTSYSENLSPEDVVKTIDHYFSEFDLIMEKYGLEKIKTIGDAYMAAGGLSFDEENQAKTMIKAAKEMRDFVAAAKDDTITSATFDIRIGINTGPVVAGVVGSKKFAYDIWGDTVNVAARMESNSEVGRINVSEATYDIIHSEFDCEYRGELNIKNHGAMKMYFVNC